MIPSIRQQRAAIAAGLAAATLGSLGCKVVIERAEDSAHAAGRSDTTIVLTSPARVDSGVVPQAPTPAPIAVPPAPSMANGEVTDTPPSGTSAADLGVLSSELIIPIAGVKASDLRDTFNEMRGGGLRKHEALDIMAPRGTPVLSASTGRVLKLHNSK